MKGKRLKVYGFSCPNCGFLTEDEWFCKDKTPDEDVECAFCGETILKKKGEKYEIQKTYFHKRTLRDTKGGKISRIFVDGKHGTTHERVLKSDTYGSPNLLEEHQRLKKEKQK